MKISRLSLAFLIAIFSALPSHADISDEELFVIWCSNGSVSGVQEFRHGMVDWEEEVVYLEGHAPLRQESAQGRLLAKRVAKIDLYRNGLLLLYEIRYGLPWPIKSIELDGKILLSGDISWHFSDGYYVVSSEVPIRDFIAENVVWRKP